MNLFGLFRNIQPFVKPYRWLVFVTLVLTLAGSLMAQVNAIVLDRTVDAINALIGTDFNWGQAARILTIISILLLGKEVLSALVTFAQNYYGERMRIFVSRDLSQAVIEKVLTFRMAFFSQDENATGKIQARIDQGVSSLSRTVQNFFIDLLPLFTSAALAPDPDVRRQCLCGAGGTGHRSGVLLDYLAAGPPAQGLAARDARPPRNQKPGHQEHH